MPRPKPKADTETMLHEARADLGRLVERLTGLAVDRDAALIDNDAGAIAAVEALLSGARQDEERARRRVSLLEERAAAELRGRQQKAHDDVARRAEDLLRQRNEAGAEVADALAVLEEKFRKLLGLNSALAAAWPWEAGDGIPMLLGRQAILAIAYEMYRLSGRPFTTSGAPSEFSLPGARSPSITDPRPEAVQPLRDKLRDAAAYAARKMRGATLRQIPVGSVSASDAPGNAEFVWRVIITNEAGETRTDEIVFDAEMIAKASLDGLGATGPRGRSIAVEAALAKAPGFSLSPEPGAVRFDVDRLARSINRE